MSRKAALFVLIVFIAIGLIVKPSFAEKRIVKIGQTPIGPSFLSCKLMQDLGIYKKWGDKINVEYVISHPQDDFAAFMGRQIDVCSFSPLELARLYGDEKRLVVMFGKYITNVIGWYVRGDSTAKTPVDLKGKKLGIPGWDTAAAQVAEVIMKEVWGLDIKKDFEIFVGPWPVLPKLLAKGDIDMIFNVMPLTMNLWKEGKIKPLYESIGQEYSKRSDGYVGGVHFFCAMPDWLDKNQDVAANLLGAYEEGIKYVYENTEDWLKEYLPRVIKNATDEDAKFMAEHFIRIDYLYKNQYLDQQYIDQEIIFLKKAEDMGIIPKGSATEDLFLIIKK